MRGVERNPEVVATELAEGAVLLNIETGFYYSVNEPGAEIWRRLDAAEGAHDLAERLRERFDVEPDRAAAAATGFVAELEREGLVTRSGRTGIPSDPAAPAAAPAGERRPFAEPELIKHDEPLHEVSMSPFDPQLPLAE
jgi:hypothetical protein